MSLYPEKMDAGLRRKRQVFVFLRRCVNHWRGTHFTVVKSFKVIDLAVKGFRLAKVALMLGALRFSAVEKVKNNSRPMSMKNCKKNNYKYNIIIDKNKGVCLRKSDFAI